MPRRRPLGPVLGLAAALGQPVLPGALPAWAEPLRCAELAKLARPDLRISRAEPVPAGTLPADNPGRAALTGAARSQAALPAHCLVQGTIRPRSGVEGRDYGVGF